MTFLSLTRFAAMALAAIVGVHTIVWGMDVMMADLGEEPVLNWTTWWTTEGWRTSALLQVRVGAVALALGAGLRACVFGVSARANLFLVFGLFLVSLLGAVILETVWLSSIGPGPGRAEVNALLGPFAHNGLTIGAALAVSHWIRYATERRFAVTQDASVAAR